MKKTFSFIAALTMGLLAVAPGLDYNIPVLVNGYAWLYLVMAAGLVGFFLAAHSGLPGSAKVFLVYGFVGCFFSQVPYLSFNAYLLLVLTFAIFLFFKECDFKIIFAMAEAAFWLELVLASVRFFGMETLSNFGAPKPLFLGTIMQHMRFGSLLCILSPFLLVKSRWYIIPVAAATILSTSSGYALSVLVGVLVYALMTMRRHKRVLVAVLVALGVAYALTLGRDSFSVAFREGRLPVWWVVAKTWVLDTRGAFGTPDFFGISQTGPFDWKAFLFGHGLDTFCSLFPAYKHDPSPFPQAHNDWLQIAWEMGSFGAILVSYYVFRLARWLYYDKEAVLLAGLAMIGTNMCFHFPWRMTQTVLLMVAFIAYCEVKLASKETHGDR